MEKPCEGGALDAETLSSLGVVLRHCAHALLNPPDPPTVRTTEALAAALGLEPCSCKADAALAQRCCDRFAVASSIHYVPLLEACIRGMDACGTAVRYGPTGSLHSDHVERCYDAVGFDWRSLPCSGPAAATLRATSLACECAFMASLCAAAADAGTEDRRARAAALLQEFACAHAAVWFRPAAERLAATDDDYYARVCMLAACAAEAAASL